MPQSTECLLRWIKFLKASYPSTELTDGNIRAYVEWLKDVPEADLQWVFEKGMEQSGNYPPAAPALKNLWKEKQAQVDKLAADKEWDRILAHVVKYGEVCYPSDEKLQIGDAGEYSLRQIGGADWRQSIAAADDNRLHWLRRNFLECWNRHAETGGLRAIGRDEARQLLDVAKRGHLLADGVEE